MRSAFLALLVLALALVAFAPVASADVNITIYSDSQCSNAIAPAQVLPCSTSPTCIQAGGGQTGSGIFLCSQSGGYDNLTISVWENVNDCSGAVDTSLTSYAKDNTCATLNIVSGGQSGTAYANIQFIKSNDSEEEEADVATLLTAAKRATKKSGARRGLERLFASKQAQ